MAIKLTPKQQQIAEKIFNRKTNSSITLKEFCEAFSGAIIRGEDGKEMLIVAENGIKLIMGDTKW